MMPGKIRTFLPKYEAEAGLVDHKIAPDRFNRILGALKAAPKSMGWKMRAKIGDKRPWHETPDVQ
jgi:hypothetical protein